jgi:uncharacterized protein
MTPQENQLVSDLFDRLAKLETAPRDPAAERLIVDGTQRAPHAVYALVQTTLLQDEALKRANARIEELQAEADGTEPPQSRPTGFLDSMRETMFGRGEPRGSVPSVRAQNSQSQGGQSQGFQSPPGYPPAPPGYPPGPAFGSGGSFLGSAASTAAGFVGGALLLDGIRSMFGHHLGGQEASAFGNLGDDRTLPRSGSAADSQLARDAGVDHVSDQVRDREDQSSTVGDDSSQTADDDDEFTDEDDFAADGGGDDYDV